MSGSGEVFKVVKLGGSGGVGAKASQLSPVTVKFDLQICRKIKYCAAVSQTHISNL